MKLRRVLLVVLLLVSFYLLTQHLWPTGTVAALMQRYVPSMNGSRIEHLTGPIGAFDLNVANAQPAYDSEEQNNIAVYKRVTPSVVNITSTTIAIDFFYGAVPQQGQGSGFILDKQGHILTNNHVIGENYQRVEVQLADKHKYKAQVVTVDKAHDLALLQINAPNLQPVELADSRNLQVGQKVFAIGNPFGLSGTMTRGIISAIRSVRGPNGNAIDNAIQTDAAINPGNSGGPLMNSHGQVIGINTMIASNNGADQSAGIGFAIPINTARAVLDDFSKYGHVRRPSLAITPLEIGPDLADQIGLPADYGVLIQRVLPGGAAERAGLKGGTQRAALGNTPVMLGGDFIVAIDGEEITNVQDISSVMNSHKTGDVVTVTAFRGRRRMDVKVTLGEAGNDRQI
ncbi:S1C family serine protease [Terriglobus roseus]|uniref:DegP2 peptidase. Serine peptidase. MEROPS family S01B n=1 Tax=Terriglobus roseus TaxID=392734 RepID=A0A1G7G6Y6_9BACT|nr:trypsin-like peptidase domain-containing protein [Terriglobus roseus]SDE83867.1 DegP2 peptidase. Serine peptidase. MEROPS family S01B [Terriglobus roseus]